MQKDCKNYVGSCHKCQVVNRRTANAYGLLQQLPIPTTPWEIVSADHMICLQQTKAGNTNMLVYIDHATCYVVATPSASLGAHSVTDALYHNIILRYGHQSMYISDRGTAITACHTQHFLQKYGITQSMTPSYSPQAKSIIERANGIIVSTLKKLTDKNPDKWDELLPNALQAINTTPREDQLDLLILARAEAANNVYEAHLENKHRFDLHLGAVCYEIKSRTFQNKFIKVVHVQHLRPYFKRDADVMQNNRSDEENDSSAENQDPAEDHQEVSVTTEPSS
ncbi:uncharacterized protein TNCV_4564521 [Trichonephila clavipes]|nr:uncharacterized protein TNCV_4564521 [Trichonephila clavipes]